MIRYRTALVVAAHGFLFALALLAAFLLAYNFRISITYGEITCFWPVELYLPLLLLSLPVKLFTFYWTGQYRGSWRYVGLRDLFGVIQAALAATFFFLIVYFSLEWLSQRLFEQPLIDRPPGRLRQSSVFLLDWAVTVAFVSAARILVRFYYEDVQGRRIPADALGHRVLIVGAGDAGEALLRELLRMRRERFVCIGFLDDDASRHHNRIHGVEVLGPTSNIRPICLAHDVREVFIAMPNATPRTIRSLVERCEGTGVTFRTVPTVPDVLSGRVRVSATREVEITDLLGRDPVELDVDRIEGQLRGKRVLVTGAGGSIGSEMCRQIAGFSPEALILLERAENALFEIDRELRSKHPDVSLRTYVADVCDRRRVEQLFLRERPHVVFHAAAHKHVPMMEANAGESIKNNVGGTMVTAHACQAAGVSKMVVISTDKAVNPVSIMGCTKRVAEMYVQSLNGQGATQFVIVRFGNVLGSSGSVVPIFKQQIAVGGPVTVTHPEMRRYFMSIPEAAQLVLQAGAMGAGGEIYVLDMGEPVKIVDLARDMITLSGLTPHVDVDIVFTGVRPGEKLFEELSSEREDIADTAHPKIGIWKHRIEERHEGTEARRHEENRQQATGNRQHTTGTSQHSDLPTNARSAADRIREEVKELLAAADSAAPDDLVRRLKRIVPEYRPVESRKATGNKPAGQEGETVGQVLAPAEQKQPANGQQDHEPKRDAHTPADGERKRATHGAGSDDTGSSAHQAADEPLSAPAASSPGAHRA